MVLLLGHDPTILTSRSHHQTKTVIRYIHIHRFCSGMCHRRVTNMSPMCHRCVTNVSPMCHQCKLISSHVARVLLCKTKPGFAMWFRQTHKHHRQLDYIRVMSFKVLLAYKVPPHTNPPSDFAKQSSATPSNLCNSCTSTEITKLTSNNSLKL